MVGYLLHFPFLGNMAPSICTLIAVYLGCTRTGAVTMYVLGLVLKAPIYSGVLLSGNDISRHYAGIIMAFTNGLASAAGILGPGFVGLLTPNVSGLWKIMLLLRGYVVVGHFTHRACWCLHNFEDVTSLDHGLKVYT